MNIFFLDKSPELAAKYLCDKHVPKMLLESSQMLSTAIQRHLGGTIGELYKPAYPKHPMTIWVGDNKNNFKWALENASFINKQYEVRFNKNHKSNRTYYGFLHPEYEDIIKDRMDKLSPIDYLISASPVQIARSAVYRVFQPILDELFNKNLDKDDRKKSSNTHF